MGAAREGTEAEKRFQRVRDAIRSLDLLLWNYCGHPIDGEYPLSQYRMIEEPIEEVEMHWNFFKEAITQIKERVDKLQTEAIERRKKSEHET